MERKVTSYRPYENSENLYVSNVQESIRNAGFDIVELKSGIFPMKNLLETQIINLNWFENIPVKSKIRQYTKFLKRILLIQLYKILGIKIIYTMHNKQPHEKLTTSCQIKMMKYMCKYSHAIIIHSNESKDVLKVICPTIDFEKVFYIKHPSYITNYADIKGKNLRNELGIAEKELIYMFFGHIKPYKNIEILIEAFDKGELRNAKLLIAGKCTKEYKEQLMSYINNRDNIMFDLRFIPDSEIMNYYETADIVVLPYNKESALNSGTLYLTFSLKKTVICPDIGSVKDISEKNIMFSYSYKNDQEHLKSLKQILRKSYEIFEERPSSIKEMGDAAYKYVKANHSNTNIEIMYKNLYNKLLGE